jgi:hypothetical protein
MVTYPIDVKMLEKGDVLPVDALAEHFRINPYTDPLGYQLRLVDFKCEIEREHNYTIATKITGKSVRVLTDIEASGHTDRKFKASRVKMRQAHKQSISIDASGFDDEERRMWERRNHQHGAILASMREAGRPKAADHVRTVPTMDRAPKPVIEVV